MVFQLREGQNVFDGEGLFSSEFITQDVRLKFATKEVPLHDELKTRKIVRLKQIA